MSQKLEAQREYRKLYKDILCGYSFLELGDGVRLYIKHLSDLDLGELEYIRDGYLQQAVEKKLPHAEEQLKILIKQEHWELRKENKILKLKQDVSHLASTAQSIVLQVQKAPIEAKIKHKKEALAELVAEKEEILGMTAEKYADKRANEESIRRSLFKDPELSTLYFSEREYDDIPDETFVEIVNKYNTVLSRFDGSELKKLSALPFFLNPFTLCKDDPFVFFGKSVVKLTHYQGEILFNGLIYKNVLSQGKSPPELYYEDLEKLVQWYALQKEGAAINDGNEAAQSAPDSRKTWDKHGTSIPGATKEEQIAFAAKHGGEIVDLQDVATGMLKKRREELKRDGKDPSKAKLTIDDFMKIHGE